MPAKKKAPMPAKKKAAAAAGPKDRVLSADEALEGDSLDVRREAIDREADESFAATRADLAAQRMLRDATGAALINQRAKVKPDPNGTIDQRMAALEQDHIRMGARPARNA